MNRAVANFYSYVFHPLLAPTYTFALLLFIYPSTLSFYWSLYNKIMFVIAIFLLTYMIPGTTTYLLVKSKQVDNITLDGQKERRLPLFLTIITYTITTIFCGYRILPGPSYSVIMEMKIPNVAIIMAINTLIIVMIYLINFRWKISAHSAGMGGVVVYAYLFTFHFGPEHLTVFILSIVIAGMVLASRIRLNSHTPSQTYAGFIIGALITLIGGQFLNL